MNHVDVRCASLYLLNVISHIYLRLFFLYIFKLSIYSFYNSTHRKEAIAFIQKYDYVSLPMKAGKAAE